MAGGDKTYKWEKKLIWLQLEEVLLENNDLQIKKCFLQFFN